MFVPYKGKFRITQAFKGATHKGIDFVGISNKNIYVPDDSDLVIEHVGKDTHPTGGMGLYIRGRRVKDGFFAYFAHLSATNVKVGDRVKSGTLLGLEGSTGRSTGSHLHYEIRTKAGDNQSYADVAKICGIKNAVGTYENMEEDEMIDFNNLTDEQVDALLQKMVKRLSAKPNSDYAKTACEKATNNGVFSDGDKNGTIDNPQGFVKREELAVVLDRLNLLK